MLKYEKGNLVTGNYVIFCQQVNCKRKMGAGLAKQIRDAYPEVYEEYVKAEQDLGHILPVFTHDGRICINMFAQDDYGTNGQYTDYTAFRTCLKAIRVFLTTHHVKKEINIAFPYGIGCKLGGGDWRVVLGLLNDFSRSIKQDVVIVSLE